MNEDQLLEALDHRAQRAVAAVDDRLAGTRPHPLPLDREPGPGRPWLPLLVAAGLVVVALLGIGLVLDRRSDEQGTVADDRDVPLETSAGVSRLALADPAALGYEVRAAFDGPSVDAAPEMTGVEIDFTAHGPSGDPAPWDRAIISSEWPADDHLFTGELVDIGGPDAVHVPVGPWEQLLWRDGDQARVLMSARVGREELISTATAAISAGWRGDGALPGHDVLLRDSPDAFQHGLEFAGLGPSGWQGIAYAAPGEEQDFVIAWRPGGDDSVRALHSLRAPSRTATIGGHAVLIAADGQGAAHATWSPADGTVVQVASYGEIEDVLARVMEHLRPIRQEDFAALVAAHPPPPDRPTVEPPDGIHEPLGDGTSIASVALAHAGATFRLDVLEDGPDRLATMLMIERTSGSSGSGAPLPNLETPFLQASGEGSGPGGGPVTPVIVSGVLPAGVPPDLAGVRVVDRSTGEDLSVVNWVTGTLEPGGDPRLVIMLVDADPAVVRVEVTFPTTAGARTWRL